MIIDGISCVSRADSGSEDNAMRVDMVQELGLNVDNDEKYQREFRIGNGKIIKSLGTVHAICSFANDQNLLLSCVFYVFASLVCPLLMGMAFLDQTETLSRNRHRLQPRLSPFNELSGFCTLNNPRRRLVCLANQELVLAHADTGSEMDLLSLAYVRKKGYIMDRLDAEEDWIVQFADGSTGQLVGSVTLEIILGHTEGPHFTVTFYVLEDLICDLLLGEHFLNETNAFHSYKESFSIVETEDYSRGINTIVWLNTIEKFFSGFFVGTSAPQPLSGMRFPF